MTDLKVIFSQQIESSKIGHENFIEREAYTTDTVSEKLLRLWASHELHKWYETVGFLNIKTFHLRKDIRIDVYCNSQLTNTYVQRRFTKNLKFDKKEEFKIKLYQGVYVLKPFGIDKKFLNLNRPFEREIQPSNFNQILNSIDYQQKSRIKFASAILYTGMTN